jgi:hypothetical protein
MIELYDYCITIEQDDYSVMKTVYILMELGVTGLDRLVEKRRKNNQHFKQKEII